MLLRLSIWDFSFFLVSYYQSRSSDSLLVNFQSFIHWCESVLFEISCQLQRSRSQLSIGKDWSLLFEFCCFLMYCCRYLMAHSFLSFFSKYLRNSFFPPCNLSFICIWSSFYHTCFIYSVVGQISFYLKIILINSILIFILLLIVSNSSRPVCVLQVWQV